MIGLLQIYILFNFYFIFIKCNLHDDLSVRFTDQRLIQKKRQDTREMCKIFNSEARKTGSPTGALPLIKYNKRKKELKPKQNKKDIANKKTKRMKRAINSVNPAMNIQDEERVETIVDKIYDDLMDKGQEVYYRRKFFPKPSPKKKDKVNAAQKSGRRFPFAPSVLEEGLVSDKHEPVPEVVPQTKRVRFPKAIVPYFIDPRTYDTHLQEVITKAFDYFEKATCIRLQRLRERPRDQQSLQNVIWLYISNPSGIRQCVHSNERAEIHGVQLVTFGYDCMSIGDISHEIMHMLGFAHEHLRPDRDQHITVLWENIKPGYKQYFEVRNETIAESLPYDYASVLHYPAKAFSRNGKVTILTENGIKIGQREALSEMDLEKISILYSNECIRRNQEYLLKTCPSVVKPAARRTVTVEEIDEYFDNRVWPYGLITYTFNNPNEFSSEEKENIKAVMQHIRNETCVEFHELSKSESHEDKSSEDDDGQGGDDETDGKDGDDQTDDDDNGADGDDETDNNCGPDGDVGTDNDCGTDGDVGTDNDCGTDGDDETDNDCGTDGDVETDNDCGTDGDVEKDNDCGKDGDVETDDDDGPDKDVETDDDDGTDKDKEKDKDKGTDEDSDDYDDKSSTLRFSSSYNFDSDEIANLVILSNSAEKLNKGITDTSTSSEEDMVLKGKIISAARKGVKSKDNTKVKPKGAKRNDTKNYANVKNANIGRKKYNINIGRKKNNTNISRKKNNTNISRKKNNINFSRKKNNTNISRKKNNSIISRKKNNINIGHKNNNTNISRKKNNINIGHKKYNTNIGRKKNNTNIGRKKNNTNISRKKNNTNIGRKKNNTNIGHKKNNTNIGRKKNNTNIGRKKNNIHINRKKSNTYIGTKKINTHIGGKVKTTNVARKPTALRKSRKVRPTRRHAGPILKLYRSSEPGCPCPRPGKPEGTYKELRLNADCFNSVNDLLHVFVHVLGLDHQHNMHDRDSYLHIAWDQLNEGIKHEMRQKLPPAASVGFPYDYQSVMHYPWLQIKDGITNIMYPIWNDGWAMGHWQGLSTIDIQKIKHIYADVCQERAHFSKVEKDKYYDILENTDDEQKSNDDNQEDNLGNHDTDEDKDNDGSPDTDEDKDNDGSPDTDKDNDGSPDTDEDKDNDGSPDTDEDKDNDGSPDTDEDKDNDGSPDTDEDKDNDGSPDTDEDKDNDGDLGNDDEDEDNNEDSDNDDARVNEQILIQEQGVNSDEQEDNNDKQEETSDYEIEYQLGEYTKSKT